MEEVEFAGYTVPHPSEPFMNVRVQTYAQGVVFLFIDRSIIFASCIGSDCTMLAKRTTRGGGRLIFVIFASAVDVALVVGTP